jgi:hypothetical protein
MNSRAFFALYVFPKDVGDLPESSQQSSRKMNPSIEKRYCCNAVAAAISRSGICCDY